MPWRPLPRIAFAVATFPFQPSSPADLPLEIGDELYLIEQGGNGSAWYRGYLVAPPSLLAGLTSDKGQTLEARVFSGIFPKSCVEVREVLGDPEIDGQLQATGVENALSPSKVANGVAKEKQSLLSHGGSIKHSNPANGLVQTNGDREGISRTSSKGQLGSGEEHRLSRSASYRSLTLPKSRQSALQLMPSTPSLRSPAQKRPPAPVPMLKIGDETPTSTSEPLVDEIAACLREWHSKNLHELLLSKKYSVLEKMSTLVRRLDTSRRQLLHGLLTDQELGALREKTVWDLVSGNKMLSNEIVVRDPTQRGRLLMWGDSIIELTKLQSAMSLLDQPVHTASDAMVLHHLMLDWVGGTATELTSPSISVALYTQDASGSLHALTESFTMDVPPENQFDRLAASGRFRTLFTDLSAADIGELAGSDTSLYLVIRVYANEPSLGKQPRPDKRDQSETGFENDKNTTSPYLQGGDKAGRRSMMWSQRQLTSSYRSRRKQENGSTKMPLNFESPGYSMNGSRPTTQETNRPSTRQGSSTVKRRQCTGVADLKGLIKRGQVEDYSIDLWCTTEKRDENSDLSESTRNLLSQMSGVSTRSFSRNKLFGPLRFNIRAFKAADVSSLIDSTPTLLQDISRSPKIGFSGAPRTARSDIYVTLLGASLSATASLSHPEKGSIELTSGQSFQDVQLTLEVRRQNGDRIEHCIHPSSNSSGSTGWRTIAAGRLESWNQVIRLAVPADDVRGAHLIMSLADAGEFPFALGWMPLWDNDAFIRDGSHQPILYAYDKKTADTSNGRGAYLSLPWQWSTRPDENLANGQIRNPATIKLETYLCSTIFSQDQVLLGLVKWKEQSPEDRLELLRRFAFVPEMEIVKLVNDIFDALFGILVDQTGKEEFEDLTFNALVIVLGIVHDRRFNLGPLVERYTDESFEFPYATPCLIRSYLRLLARPADPQNSRLLRATFKVGRQILRFIITARKKQKIKEAGIGITSTQTTFTRDLKSIFTSLESLMKDTSPILLGSKTLVIQHMHSWLPVLSSCLTQTEIFDITSSFIASCEGIQGKFILYKLIFLSNLSNTELFISDDTKDVFNAAILRWLDPYWGLVPERSDQWLDQIRLCCTITASQNRTTNPLQASYFVKVIDSYRSVQLAGSGNRDRLSLLFPTNFPFPSRSLPSAISYDETLIELSALFALLGERVKSSEFLNAASDLATTVSETLKVISSILNGDAFPKNWLSLRIYHHKSCLQILEALSESFLNYFLPSPDDAEDFPTDLWNQYLLTLLGLVRSEALTLETFPEQKRRAVWKIAGDVREQGAFLLRRSWDAIGWETNREEQQRYGIKRLGGFQVQYVPSMVAPIVELCLSVHEGLRNTAVHVLQTMFLSEWTLNEDLSAVQTEMIDSLDRMFKTKNLADSISRKLFVTELLERFSSLSQVPNEPLWEAIKHLVSVIDELLDLVSAVYSSDSSESYKIMHTIRLMDFLKDMQRQNIYIRYVHQLAQLQMELGNHTEAGLAIKLHANLYDWSFSVVEALGDPELSQQTCFERKEQLYFQMIQHFENGAAWDSALQSYRELADQYEHNNFDFAKLARTQRAMAKIYETIVKWEKHPPRYFKVTYLGLGFPPFLRDKEFIFEGTASERMSSFTDRMRHQHPSAQIIPAGDVDQVEGQYLQISPVSPHRNLADHIFQQSKIQHSVREHILSSSPFRFSVTSRRHSPSSGVHDQWIEKTVYCTAEAFPTTLKRSEIIDVEVVRLTPLQTAVERTTRKTAELATLAKRVSDGDESAVLSVAEAIKSSVDPSSIATVAQYRALLSSTDEDSVDGEDQLDDKEKEVPPADSLQNALRYALMDHTSTLKSSLTLLSRHGLTEEPLLADHLQRTFAPELAALAPPNMPSDVSQIEDMHDHSFTSFLSPSQEGNESNLPPFATITTSSPPPQHNGLSKIRGDTSDHRPSTDSTKKSRLSLLFASKQTNSSSPKPNGAISPPSQQPPPSIENDLASAALAPSVPSSSHANHQRNNSANILRGTTSLGSSKGLNNVHTNDSNASGWETTHSNTSELYQQPPPSAKTMKSFRSVFTTTTNGDGKAHIGDGRESLGGDDENRPVTAHSGRSARVKKRLSLLGLGGKGKGSVRSRTTANTVSMVEEE